MPNYCAHVFFGEKVIKQLPDYVRASVAGSREVFQSGLLGPDPVMFSPGCRWTASALHGKWQEDTSDVLGVMLQGENPQERSFAAGYLCHMMLDDVCHAKIKRWQREDGMSHLLLELGLDWMVLREQGENHFPNLEAANSGKVSQLAAKLIKPALPWQYRMGLLVMKQLYRPMKLAGPWYIAQIKETYRKPTQEMLGLLESTAVAAAKRLTMLCGGEQSKPEMAAAASF